MRPLDYITAHSEDASWKRLARDPRNKIDAIKSLRHETGMGLADAKDVVEEYVRRVEVTAAGLNLQHTVKLPEGFLTITQNGLYATIQYTRTEAVNVRIPDLQQAIVDAVIRITSPVHGPRA